MLLRGELGGELGGEKTTKKQQNNRPKHQKIKVKALKKRFKIYHNAKK